MSVNVTESGVTRTITIVDETGTASTVTVGLPGLQGERGPAGQDGAPGQPGRDGQDGQDGAGIHAGTGAPAADGAVDGDLYVDVATGDLYRWAASAWLAAGNIAGPAGTDGREVELTKSASAIQWRYVGDAAWSDLVALTDITGPAGADGQDGQPGADGAPGVDGADGADGKSAYQVAVDNGFVGTEAAWLASLVGPAGTDGADGADGSDGAPGPANVLTVGTVTTAAAGSPAAVSITGDSPSQTVDFTIPRGADGANGTDGADGAPGADGADGQSAYEIAVANGFSGTEQEWLDSLHGADGADGTDGTNGTAATVTVGTTTTLPAGSSATVTNSGTSSAAVLDFGIPQGADGSGSGSGGLSRIILGPSTPGASMLQVANKRVYLRKVTLTVSGLMTNIEAYIDEGANPGRVVSWAAALHRDNGGSYGEILSYNESPNTGLYLAQPTTGRWFGLPVSTWLPAGDYWLAVSALNDGYANALRIGYDTGTADGTTGYYTTGGNWFADGVPGGGYAYADSDQKWSIRANVITG